MLRFSHWPDEALRLTRPAARRKSGEGGANERPGGFEHNPARELRGRTIFLFFSAVTH
jgi:hypothetical protein